MTNINIVTDELFDYFIHEFIFYYNFFQLLEHSKYLIIFPSYKIFLNFLNFGNFLIFQIKKLQVS